jgi:Ca-activated chloride channel family protein
MKNTHFQTKTNRLFILMLFIGLFSAVAAAQTDDDKTLSPYFLVNGDPAVDQLPLKDTSVDIAVSGVIADVKVTQTYKNEGTRPINATYVFPASTRAAVYAMRMRIGNQLIIAKIKERDLARKEFEEAKKEGKSASLLEQDRPNVFSMNMANLMPGEQIEIELRYTELLVPTKGVYEMVYPTVVGPRYSSQKNSEAGQSDKFVNSGYLRKDAKPTSTLHISATVSAGLPIQEISCVSHRIRPSWTGQTTAEFTLDEPDAFQGNRDFILRYSLAGSQIDTGLLLYQGKDENFFLYMAQPPARVKPEAVPSREYIFVVDVSGSMEGFPLETSKKLLEDLIMRLRPRDYFNVVLFAGDSTMLSNTPMPANEANTSRAVQFIEQQRGAGGTELLAAMKQAMSLPGKPGVSRSIVVVTDGYISAEDGVFQYIRDNLNRTNVFAFGIGSSVNRYLIEGVAKAGMGEPFVITGPEEAPSVAADFRDYIETPVLTDVRVEASGFDTYDVNPVQLPDLFAERPVIVFGKWRGPVVGSFKLTGRTGFGEFDSEFDVSGARPEDSNRALRYLWARSKIDELSDFGVDTYSDNNAAAITGLGLKYNLLTKYTSFIAVRELIVNPDGSAQDVSQPLPLPLGVSEFAVGAEPEFVWLAATLALILLLAAFARYRGEILSNIFQAATVWRAGK